MAAEIVTVTIDETTENITVDISSDMGPPGLSAYEVAVDNGFVGTEAEWLTSLENGPSGDSAYQVAVNNGFIGTEAAWLLSLKGSDADVTAALSDRLFFRTALTGGTAASLDGVATTALVLMTPCLVSQSGVLSMWQLQTWDGVTAENTGNGLVLPDDANAITNLKIWVRLS